MQTLPDDVLWECILKPIIQYGYPDFNYIYAVTLEVQFVGRIVSLGRRAAHGNTLALKKGKLPRVFFLLIVTLSLCLVCQKFNRLIKRRTKREIIDQRFHLRLRLR